MAYATLDQIAKVLNITPRMVNKHVKDNGLPRIGRGSYDLVACVHWYIDYLKAQNKQGQPVNLQAKKLELEIKHKQMDMDEREGKLVNRASVLSTWGSIAAVTKSKLQSIPRKLAIQLVGLTAPEIEDLLSKAVRESLQEIEAECEKNGNG